MSTKEGNANFPGAGFMEGIFRGYTGAWQRQLDALNEVWGDLTSSEAKLATVTSGFSKLAQAWTDSLRDLSTVYVGNVYGPSGSNPGMVTFVLDNKAQASGQPEAVPVPANVDGTRIKATGLFQVGGGPPIEGKLDVGFDPTRRCLEVRIVKLADPPLLQPGYYLATVYEDRQTPPKRPLALVHLTIVA
jgi:hypothetical protein